MKNEKKKSVHNASIVNAVIKTYRETGTKTDPAGMYTGVTQEMSSVGMTAACPDTKTPTDAIISGKTYRSRWSLENIFSDGHSVSYMDAMPQQDADDL